MYFVKQSLEGFEVDNLNKGEPVKKNVDATNVPNKDVKIDATNVPNKDANISNGFGIVYVFILLIWGIWVFAGITAFIMSLVCSFYNGSTTDKFVGVILAWIFGPFYWLYYIYNSSYCTRFVQQPVPQQQYY